MAKLNEVYKCNTCGNIVEVVHANTGELNCCGQSMERLKENTEDSVEEKHFPVMERGEGSVTVKIGEVAHPMDGDHYIEWIELVTENGVDRKYLKPGDKPEAEFVVSGKKISARAYCNLHGLWASI